MEIYDISIAPGQVRDIFVNGSYVYFYSGSAGGADATITVNQDSRGQRVLLMPGQAYRMPDGQVGTRWLIGNHKGEGTIVGRLVIGSGELTDNRVTGSVEVIDGGKYRTMAGQVFGWRASFGALPSNYSFGQIFNPAGSGKRLLVKSYSASGGNVIVGWAQAEIGAELGSIGNKLSGGSASVCRSRKLQQTSASLAGAGFAQVGQIQSGATFIEPEPIVINPGHGFVIATDAPGQEVVMTAHFVEEAIG